MVVLPFLVLGAMLGILSALRGRPVLTVTAEEHADVVALHRHLSRWRVAGLAGAALLAIAAVVAVPHLDLGPDRVRLLGRAAALAPAIGGLSLLLGTLVGEITARPVRSALRFAPVETRRVRDFLPRHLSLLVCTGLVLLLALLVIASLLGSADDLGRSGRELTLTCAAPGGPAGGSWPSSASTGPWPGSYYAVPISAALAMMLAAAGVALAVIVRRPRPGTAATALDTALRRHAGRKVILGIGVVVFGTLGPIAGVMAAALAANGCRPTWWALPVSALGVAGAAGATIGAWCLLGLLAGPVLRISEPGDGKHGGHHG